MEFKIFSFFSGSGFLDLGFELNGFSVEMVNEFSPSFMNAYRYSRKQMNLRVPKYGYQNTDVNEYLNERAEELWFHDNVTMPAVMEVEHTTGVTSGLTRMKGFQDKIPSINTRYVIVAPDKDREKVIEEVNKPQFRSLDARYFPYSSVEELYYICTHRNLHGVDQEFLDCYMEKACVSSRMY